MASKLSAIEAQMKTDLLTTSLAVVFVGLGKETTKQKAAWFIIGGGEVDDGSYNVKDVTHDMQIWIEDGTRDDVNTIVEEAMVLWEDLTKHNVLRALGVLDINNVGFTYAVETGADNRYAAIMEFEIKIRHTY